MTTPRRGVVMSFIAKLYMTTSTAPSLLDGQGVAHHWCRRP